MPRLVIAVFAALTLATGVSAGAMAQEFNLDCSSFGFQEEAQAVYDADPSDPYGLDGPVGPASGSQPGVACPSLPTREEAGIPAVETLSTPAAEVPASAAVMRLPSTGIGHIVESWRTPLTLLGLAGVLGLVARQARHYS